jgi:DNA-binding HxlR family transcriptional regulator
MYERKITEDLDCGIVVAMKVFGSKWKPCIIDYISRGFLRPAELHREIPMATPRVLDMQLKELSDFGIVEKTIFPGFPLKVEYSLTALGEGILPIVRQMDEWGTKNKEHIKEVHSKMMAAMV